MRVPRQRPPDHRDFARRRTRSRFPAESPWAPLNDGFGRDVLGSPWVSRRRHGLVSTRVQTHRWCRSPDPRGSARRPSPRSSWLYRVDLAPDCESLLWGSPVDTSDGQPQPGPTAWIREQRRLDVRDDARPSRRVRSRAAAAAPQQRDQLVLCSSRPLLHGSDRPPRFVEQGGARQMTTRKPVAVGRGSSVTRPAGACSSRPLLHGSDRPSRFGARSELGR